MSLDIEQQYDKIFHYCYFKVNNAFLAEDLTQETFLRYFSQNSYIERGKPLAYLYTIAKHLCSDHSKKQQLEELNDDIPSKDKMEQIALQITVKQAVQTLPAADQELLLLRYANELSIGEICEITELSRFAVYRKVKSAISQLKLVLREEDFIE